MNVTKQPQLRSRNFSHLRTIFLTRRGSGFGCSGGCSGFQYSLNIEEESKQGDFVLDKFGIKLFVDMFSAQYLNGITVDYTSNMMGSGFTFENPNATGGCGCGTSFSA